MTRQQNSPGHAALRLLYYAGFAGTVLAVGMQMRGKNGGFITNYLADLAGPMWFYAMTRQHTTLLRYIYRPVPSPLQAAVFVFIVGTVWEVCEGFDFSGTILAITRGRFDPYDILAYAASLIVCYAVDTCVRRKEIMQKS